MLTGGVLKNLLGTGHIQPIARVVRIEFDCGLIVAKSAEGIVLNEEGMFPLAITPLGIPRGQSCC